MEGSRLRQAEMRAVLSGLLPERANETSNRGRWRGSKSLLASSSSPLPRAWAARPAPRWIAGAMHSPT